MNKINWKKELRLLPGYIIVVTLMAITRPSRSAVPPLNCQREST